MLRITLLEGLIRGVPEAFIMVLAMYAFSNKKLDEKKYLISSLTIAIIMYLVRILPISYGVHTILNVFVLIFLTFNVNKIDLIVSIKSSILVLLTLFICESTNIWLVHSVLNCDLDVLFNNPMKKIISGIPSTIMFATIVTSCYILASQKGKLR